MTTAMPFGPEGPADGRHQPSQSKRALRTSAANGDNKTLAKMVRTTGRVAPDPGVSLKPGARLVREWRGRTHTVTVTEDGFDYAGTSYPSLTRIAKKITGAHWSGPRFFGFVRDGRSAKDTIRA